MFELADVLVALLEEPQTEDELVDAIQELEPPELAVICRHAWVLELILAYCKAKET